MDLSINADSNTSAPSDDKEKQLVKTKPIKFRETGAILETPTLPTGRLTQPLKEDCMQPKIRLERLCFSANGSNSLRGTVRVRDIPNCCIMATAMENGYSGTVEKDGSETVRAEHQNHAPTDDKERPCGLKRVKTPSSTLNKKKPYRAARRDESGIPSTASVATEPVHNGIDIVIKPHGGDLPADRASESSFSHLNVRQIDDRALKGEIEPRSSTSTPQSEEVKLEQPEPRANEDPVVDVHSKYQEDSRIVAKTVALVAKRSDDLKSPVDAADVLEERSMVRETTGIKDTEGVTAHLGVTVSSIGKSEDAENSEKQVETDASPLHLSFEKNADTEFRNDRERRKIRKTPSYWRRATTDETTTSVDVKTALTCHKRKETLRCFYPIKEAVVQPRLARTFPRKRSTSFYFRGNISLAGLQNTRSKTGAGSRSLASVRPSTCRRSRKAQNLKARKTMSDVFARRVSENLKGPTTNNKFTASLRNSTNKTKRSKEQLACTNHLTSVQVNGCTDNPDKRKSGSVEEVSRTTENPRASASSSPSANPTDVPKVEQVYRSMFDNFVESEVNICYRADDGDERSASQKAESTPAEVHATENRRDNIFEKFRSSMQGEETTADCLNLSKKKGREGSDKRQVPDISRETEDLCVDAIPPDHPKDIKELLGDYDSDSTECCKYDELDAIYSDNQTTKDAQLGGFLAERTENFYPGFSVFNMLSDSDDNLVVDESMDSQAVETSEQKSAPEPNANSDDEDRQLKKLRNTAYRTYTRKRKQMLQQKEGHDGIATEVGSRRTPPCNSPLFAEIKVVQRQEDDTKHRSKALDPKAEQPEGKRRGRASKKTKIKPVKRRKTGMGKSPKTVPASRHTLLMERKKVKATKKRAKVCKEFATRSKTRNRDADEPNVPLDNSVSSINPEMSEITGSNNDTTGNNVEAVPRGKFQDKKIRNGGCRRRQGRPPTKKGLGKLI